MSLVDCLLEEGLDKGLAQGSDDDPGHLGRVARLTSQAWRLMRVAPNRVDLDELSDLARRAASEGGVSGHIRTSLDYLRLWAEFNRFCSDREIARAPYYELFVESHISELWHRIDSVGSELSSRYGPLMFEAMLTSLRDRSGASRMFADLRAEEPAYAAALRLDQFSATYFCSEELLQVAEHNRQSQAALMEAREVLRPHSADGGRDVLLLFSSDPGFMRAYFPYWAPMAETSLASHVHLHFIVVGEAAECADTVERCVDLVHAQARLRGTSAAAMLGRLSFSTAPVPDGVEEAKTFAACARYLFVREVAASFDGPILILDIDAVLRDDPTRFFGDVGEGRFERPSFSVGKGVSTLIPARRYMAGGSLFPGAAADSTILAAIEQYTWCGLPCSPSWTLDQNALAYATELVDPTELGDLWASQSGWPLSQPLVGRTVKKMARQDFAVADRGSRRDGGNHGTVASVGRGERE